MLIGGVFAPVQFYHGGLKPTCIPVEFFSKCFKSLISGLFLVWGSARYFWGKGELAKTNAVDQKINLNP